MTKWVAVVTVPFAGHRRILDRFSEHLRTYLPVRTVVLSFGWQDETKENNVDRKSDLTWLRSQTRLGTSEPTEPTEWTWPRAAELTSELENWVRSEGIRYGRLPSLIVYDFFAVEGFFVAKHLRIPCACSVPAIPGPNQIHSPMWAEPLKRHQATIDRLAREFDCGPLRVSTMSDAFFLHGADETWFWAPPLMLDPAYTAHLADSHPVGLDATTAPTTPTTAPANPTASRTTRDATGEPTASRTTRDVTVERGGMGTGRALVYVCLGTIVTNQLWRADTAGTGVRTFVVELFASLIAYAHGRGVSMLFCLPGPDELADKIMAQATSKANAADQATSKANAAEREHGRRPGLVQVVTGHDQERFLRTQRPAVFVTHGGGNSVREALEARVPMVVVPFFGDQHQSADRVQQIGAGFALLCDDHNPGHNIDTKYTANPADTSAVTAFDASTKRASFRRKSLDLLHAHLDSILRANLPPEIPDPSTHRASSASVAAPKPVRRPEHAPPIAAEPLGITAFRPLRVGRSAFRSWRDPATTGCRRSAQQPALQESADDEPADDVDANDDKDADVGKSESAVTRALRLCRGVITFNEGDLLFGANGDRRLFAECIAKNTECADVFQVGNMTPFSRHPGYQDGDLPRLIDQYNDVALDYRKYLAEWMAVGGNASEYGRRLFGYRRHLVRRLRLDRKFTKPIASNAVPLDSITDADRWTWAVCLCALEYFFAPDSAHGQIGLGDCEASGGGGGGGGGSGYRRPRAHFLFGPSFVYGRNKITTWELKWLMQRYCSSIGDLLLYSYNADTRSWRRLPAVPTAQELGIVDHVREVRARLEPVYNRLRAILLDPTKLWSSGGSESDEPGDVRSVSATYPCQLQARLKSVSSAASKLEALPPGRVVEDWIGLRLVHPFGRNLAWIAWHVFQAFPIMRIRRTERGRVWYLFGCTSLQPRAGDDVIQTVPFEIQIWPTILYACFEYEHDRVYKAACKLTPADKARSAFVRHQEHKLQDLIDACPPPVPYTHAPISML